MASVSQSISGNFNYDDFDCALEASSKDTAFVNLKEKKIHAICRVPIQYIKHSITNCRRFEMSEN